MKLFCANCGLPLSLTRKAMPKLGIIIELVNYHECSETPVPFDINALVPKPTEEKQKFVQQLNALDSSKPLDIGKAISKGHEEGTRPRFAGVGTDDLRDRRFDTEQPKSTAPGSVMEQIKAMSNSIPSHDLKGIEEGTDSEMGG